jgi:hypothetical protein
MKLFRMISLLIFLGMIAASCAPAEIESVDSHSDQADSIIQAITLILPNSGSQSAEDAATDECVACHTDKDRLIETADPVVEGGESESKGVG